MTPTDSTEPEPVAEKPIRWRRLYLFVVLFFIVEVALFYLLTRAVH